MLNTKEEIYFSVIIITIFAFLLVGIIITTAILYHNRRKLHLLERSTFAQTLLQSQLEIKEQTLQHLAVELHDNLGQIASLIKINLNTIKVEETDKAKLKVEETKELVRQLITDLKLLSVSLNSNRVTQLGITKSLEDEVARLNKIGLFKIMLQQVGSVALADNATIIIFRMAQEILNNALKHSTAKNVTISISVSDNLFSLSIVDDGTGFNLADKLKTGGSGLLNLQSRAKLIGATISIQSKLAVGTTVSILLPI